jgi:glycosyltransferase involved in cell wall biosynthesis
LPRDRHTRPQAPRQRVLHVLKHFRPTFTGMGIFAERITPVMDVLAPGIAHDMLATETPEPAGLVPAASTLRRVIYLSRGPLPYWRRQWSLYWWLLRHLREYSVVHFHTHVDRYFIAYLLAKLFGRRVILSATLDDSVPGLLQTYRPATRRLARRLFGLFDAYIALSPKLHAETASVVAPGKAHMVPMGVTIPDADRPNRAATRAALGIAPDDFVMIFVGGICDRKDPCFVVEHLPEIRRLRANAKLLVVGPVLEAPHRERMQREIDRHGLRDAVIFTGEVRDPYPLFEAADVMTFPSHLEGLGAVVIEAMAHGLPVVVRDLPGINDFFVLEGETGYRFRSVDEYLAALRRLIADPDHYRALGAAARRFAIRHFDQIVIARRYFEIYGLAPAIPASAPSTQAADADPEPPLIRTLASMPASVSIVDERFRTPVQLPAQTPPLLITSIDAEEEFDWSQPFSRAAVGISSMAEQHKAHTIFSRHGVVPTYLLDYPVASQHEGYAPLLDYLQDGLCEIGTQLHPWVNPPFQEDINLVNSFPGNLPLGLEYEKLRILTETIAQNLGVPPRVYRAGRYGVGRRTGDILRQLRYQVDTSVVPQRDFGHEGGPDFFGFPANPFWLDEEKQLLELPVSSDVVGSLSPMRPPMARVLFGEMAERAGLTGTLARTGLAERIKLTPEGITIGEAKKLVRAMLARGTRVFTLSYHSPSLMPGSTPYVRDAKDLARFLAWLDEFYDFFIREIGGKPVTYGAFYALASAARTGSAPRPVTALAA